MLYGRRRGRPLRLGQRELFTTLLPRVAITLPEAGTLDPYRLFDLAPRDVWLEIGFGGGEHLAQQAASHPEIGMIGCEVFENGVVKLLGEIHRRGLRNVRVLPTTRGRCLATLARSQHRPCLHPVSRSLAEAAPPQAPPRRARRRSTVLAGIMRDGAELRLATDDADYLAGCWMSCTSHPDFEWLVAGPVRLAGAAADWPATRYEARRSRPAGAPDFLRLRRRLRGVRGLICLAAPAGFDYIAQKSHMIRSTDLLNKAVGEGPLFCFMGRFRVNGCGGTSGCSERTGSHR